MITVETAIAGGRIDLCGANFGEPAGVEWGYAA